MNIQIRTPTTSSPISGQDVLDVLTRRLAFLETERKGKHETLLGLEKTNAGRTTSPDVDKANALLDGEPLVVGQVMLSQIAALREEIRIIDNALRIGRLRHEQLSAERAGEIWAAHFEEISSLEKARLDAALEIQKINRKREVLRDKLREAGAGPFLPSDNVELLGPGDRVDEVAEAAERLVWAKVIAPSYLEKARRRD